MKQNMRTPKLVKGLHLFVIAALLAGLTLPLRPTPVAYAVTYEVDCFDDDAGATACTAAANDCSLRGAITLPAGIYTLTGAAGEDANATGDLDITGDLTIIDGNKIGRVLHIISGTIRNGKTPNGSDGPVALPTDGGNGSLAPVVIAATMAPIGTTTTILQHTPDPSLVGAAIWVEFQVAPNLTGGASVDGTITVSDGTGATCSRTVDPATPGWPYPGGWRWSCNLYPTTVGAKTLTATFTPLDPNLFSPSTSAGVSHQVNKANTTTTVTFSPPSPYVGQSINFTANVSVVPPGGGTPSPGTVTFYDSGVLLDSAGCGQWTYSTPLSVGSHSITADYSGDSNYNGSTSSPVTVMVNAFGTIIVEKQTEPDGDQTGFTFRGDAADTISDGQQIVVADLEAAIPVLGGNVPSRKL